MLSLARVTSVSTASSPARWFARVSLNNGWTGGQYSLVRGVFGLTLTIHFLQLLFLSDSSAVTTALLLAGVALSVCFALGIADRLAALAIFYTWVCLLDRDTLSANSSGLLVGCLLLAHACIPGRPYGSWAARGRIDPGGGWRLPGPIFAAAWILMAAAYAWSGAAKLASSSWLAGSVELLVAPLALVAGARPWLWLALLSMHGARMALLGATDLSMGLAMLHLFSFDPAWVRARAAGESARLFYDGGCGLCHAAVRLVIAEDPQGRAFRFAPLASEAFETRVSPEQRAALPDSLVLTLPDGRVLVRGAAVREIGARLGGVWRLLALASRILPSPWLDTLYDVVARHRARLFAAPGDTCPLVPSELRARFD